MPLKRPVIIEGPDGSGKSTLLRRLSQSLNLPIHHTGGPPLDTFDLQSKLWKLHDRKLSHLIDRAPQISEPIYGPIGGRPPFLPRHFLQKDLMELKPLVVYCRLASVREMFQSVERGPKPHKSPEHLREVLEQYSQVVLDYDDIFRALANSRSVKVVRYDWTENPYQAVLEEVQKCVA